MWMQLRAHITSIIRHQILKWQEGKSPIWSTWEMSVFLNCKAKRPITFALELFLLQCSFPAGVAIKAQAIAYSRGKWASRFPIIRLILKAGWCKLTRPLKWSHNFIKEMQHGVSWTLSRLPILVILLARSWATRSEILKTKETRSCELAILMRFKGMLRPLSERV